jgi:N-acetylated-alpha-linked acidic dipeptidase
MNINEFVFNANLYIFNKFCKIYFINQGISNMKYLKLLMVFLFAVSVYSQTGSDQKQIEKKFDSYLNAKDLDEYMKVLSAHPHHTGSAYDKSNAEYIAGLFKTWGFDTHIEEFTVLFPTPKMRILEMTSPEKFKATLSEPALKEDASSSQTNEQLPTYNAYSIDGDVAGELVYVNYGVPEDYDVLAENGIDVKGKIVIARYGKSWRGIKPKVAAEHGAIGCIIYSDPREDGYYQGDVYPEGAYRSNEGVQRGSVMDMPLYTGDPLTPFIGATKDAKRLKMDEVKVFTKIPVLPISYGDAIHFLKYLSGQVVPPGWRGALPITYHFGPGKTVVHLKVESNWNMVPIHDVIAKLKGSEFPDEWIIRGNHQDAWVNGAADPLSGLVALMEEAKGVGELVKTGWKPRRTMIYCAWDAEEEGLIGSTEWAETHADELKEKTVAYINSDGNGRGFLHVSGSHSLEHFVNLITKDVVDPETKIPVIERRRAYLIVNGSPETQIQVREKEDIPIYAMGSGSDYTPFIQHLGIASLNVGYGGEDGGGEYHSIYDSYDHFIRFGDPGYVYGVTLAQTAGRLMLRLADADILPYKFSNSDETIGKYISDLMKLTDDMREETKLFNENINKKYFLYSSDPAKTYVVPPLKTEVPYIDFSPLQNAEVRLKAAADEYDNLIKKLKETDVVLSEEKVKELNGILLHTERALTLPDGLPGRPWYTHQIYAPGFYTGYGVKTLPAVREAIEQRNWDEAAKQIKTVAGVLDNYTTKINSASEILKAEFNK